MGKNSKIEWTHATWNPWYGCKKISPGCQHCYMYREMTRYNTFDPYTVTRSKTTFRNPLKWKEPQLVFTCSWSDFFIQDADAWRAEAWEIIRQTPHLIYQILTKRPENIPDRLPDDWGSGYPNVYLGVSVENADYLWRILCLYRIPATLYWVSLEPLLGPLNITPWLGYLWECPVCGYSWDQERCLARPPGITKCKRCYAKDVTYSDVQLIRKGLQGVVAGGESGPNARVSHPEWFRSIRDQCQEAHIPFHFKQWGAWCPVSYYELPDKYLTASSEVVKLSRDRLQRISADCLMGKVGKEKAGRLLDGREWNEIPK